MNRTKEIVYLMVLLGVLTTTVATQVKPRTIRESPVHRNSPIMVVGRELGDVSFNAENRVWGDRDWLKHLVFAVKNVSRKNIIYFEITLLIRKQGQLPASVAFPVEFGSQMTANGDSPKTAATRTVLVPGEVTKSRISDLQFSRWTRELEKYGIDEVFQVSLDIRTVEFDDGTAWYVGTNLRRDPTGERMWIPAVDTDTKKGSSPSFGWLASVVPIPAIMSICSNTTTLIPAISRNFFASTRLPTSECGYFAGIRPYNHSCSGCTDPDDYIGCDRRLDDGLLPNPPAQDPSFGELIDQLDGCRGDPNFPGGPPTCNTCPTFVRKSFQSLSGVETCNLIDDDCDGRIDEDDVCCVPGEVPFCDFPLYTNMCLKCCTLTEGGECVSPIIIDTEGDGFAMTDVAGGVNFDLDADGIAERLSWAALGSDEACPGQQREWADRQRN